MNNYILFVLLFVSLIMLIILFPYLGTGGKLFLFILFILQFVLSLSKFFYEKNKKK